MYGFVEKPEGTLLRRILYELSLMKIQIGAETQVYQFISNYSVATHQK